MLANRGILATLALLLALGPFLHGHFGSAHLSGFHLDGLDALEHLHAAGSSEQANPYDFESPAVGVALAVSRSDELRGQPAQTDDGQPVVSHLVSDLLAWSCVFALLAPRFPREPARCADLARQHSRPGLPPPALAPPALN